MRVKFLTLLEHVEEKNTGPTGGVHGQILYIFRSFCIYPVLTSLVGENKDVDLNVREVCKGMMTYLEGWHKRNMCLTITDSPVARKDNGTQEPGSSERKRAACDSDYDSSRKKIRATVSIKKEHSPALAEEGHNSYCTPRATQLRSTTCDGHEGDTATTPQTFSGNGTTGNTPRTLSRKEQAKELQQTKRELKAKCEKLRADLLCFRKGGRDAKRAEARLRAHDTELEVIDDKIGSLIE